MTLFSDLGLIEPLFKAVAAQGYTSPTPIQAQAIPALLQGRDVLGIAQTGTGKTAAFALPILQKLATDKRRASPKGARALILTPTRELACQIADDFAVYGKHLSLRCVVIHGGVSQNPQVNAVRNGIDVMIATPGRLLDLIEQRHIDLSTVEVFVLDEADRMLDMGFIRDVRSIAARLPAVRQTLMFSATMPEGVASLVNSLLKNFVRIEVTPQATTVERIDQKLMFVTRDNKRRLLDHILQDRALARVIVFSRTKHGANRIAEQLVKNGVRAEAIHGNKSQNARQKALDAFKAGGVRVLVATDIAARGIDVDGVTHVINFDLPMEPESYVHRIGRTARASADGAAVSFCDAEEISQLRAIEREIRQPVPVDANHPFHVEGLATRSSGGGGNSRGGAKPNRGGRPQNRGPRRGSNNNQRRDGGDGHKRGGSSERPWSNRAA
ncbi:MAG: DEAD/DEAH box helicase [Rhodospirillaceae bacterium]|nr:MAG: DEAD/DEAH box helicase [Rhodospirillaceae bacterium]